MNLDLLGSCSPLSYIIMGANATVCMILHDIAHDTSFDVAHRFGLSHTWLT